MKTAMKGQSGSAEDYSQGLFDQGRQQVAIQDDLSGRVPVSARETEKRQVRATYCIVLIIALLICTWAGATVQTIKGETGSGAKYLLAMPDNWNGDLVVYAHGIVAPETLPIELPSVDDIDDLRDLWTSNGYAVAYSSFSKNGFAVKEGVSDTRKLNALFSRRFGKPDRRFLVGHSLGGAVCVRLAEFYPQHYNGILTVAGMVGGAQAEIDYMADVRILWELFYPGALPGKVDSIPSGVGLPEVVLPIQMVITTNGMWAEVISLIDQTPVPWTNANELVESYATALGFWYNSFDDVVARSCNKGFINNSDTVYTSIHLPPLVLDGINANAERFDASNQAAQYFRRYYEPTGKLAMPHLALHNSRDPAVPVFHQVLYAEKVAEQGDADMLVQCITNRYGHTEPFKAPEVFGAFEKLVDWVDTGIAPAP